MAGVVGLLGAYWARGRSLLVRGFSVGEAEAIWLSTVKDWDFSMWMMEMWSEFEERVMTANPHLPRSLLAGDCERTIAYRKDVYSFPGLGKKARILYD